MTSPYPRPTSSSCGNCEYDLMHRPLLHWIRNRVPLPLVNPRATYGVRQPSGRGWCACSCECFPYILSHSPTPRSLVCPSESQKLSFLRQNMNTAHTHTDSLGIIECTCTPLSTHARASPAHTDLLRFGGRAESPPREREVLVVKKFPVLRRDIDADASVQVLAKHTQACTRMILAWAL